MKKVTVALLLFGLFLSFLSCSSAPSATPSIKPTPTPTATVKAEASPTNPSPSPTGAPQVTAYTVQAGDTLYSIAAKFGSTVEAIAAANKITNPDVISVGQQLVIPKPTR